MISTEQLAEVAFQPGNLVHGTELSRLVSIIDKGIEVGGRHEKMSWSPDYVCFALLTTYPLIDRYHRASHEGPEISGNDKGVGILVDRSRLLGRFPNNLKAVGEHFWNKKILGNHTVEILTALYEYNPENYTVFQIPIEQPGTLGCYPDEIRLELDYPFRESVTFDFWEGLVVHPKSLDIILGALGRSIRRVHLPVFSPTAELLTIT